MGLRENMRAALDRMYQPDQLGEEIRYNAAAIDAVVKLGENPAVDSGRHKLAEVGTLRVRASDVPAPAYRDVVLLADDPDPWHMTRILRRTSDGWLLRIERSRRRTP